MSRPDIIALTSTRGRSGKDTLVEKLREAGYEVHRVAFGDVLKDKCAEILTFSREARIVMNSHMHTDLKDALFDELAIQNIPDSQYRDWLSETHVFSVNEMDLPRSPRWHLQQYGTGFRRNHCKEPDVWLNEGLKLIKQAHEDSLVVVTDMRQANEYLALNDLGAHLVRIQRDWTIPEVDNVPLHATDTELLGYVMDALVENRWGHPDEMLTQLEAQGVL